ncbi:MULTISPECIES: hypothetical protein [unclassified Nocardioides]|uniref:hypothetical protein n=1 Tax=unclassified Nocardioides TaxID=2615069 RepID=UPI00301463A2
MSPDVHDPATAAAVLAAAETSVRTRRAAALEDLHLVLAWADLHRDNPQHQPGAIPVRYGGDQLIDVGGDGTPLVQDLCLGELAIARHTHLLSTRALMADALDLRHRLPQRGPSCRPSPARRGWRAGSRP